MNWTTSFLWWPQCSDPSEAMCDNPAIKVAARLAPPESTGDSAWSPSDTDALGQQFAVIGGVAEDQL